MADWHLDIPGANDQSPAEALAVRHRREVRVLMLCSEAGCTEEATTGSRCREHERERNRGFISEHKSIYNTRKWTFTRRRVLFERPLCKRCGESQPTFTAETPYEDPYKLDGLERSATPVTPRSPSRAVGGAYMSEGLLRQPGGFEGLNPFHPYLAPSDPASAIQNSVQ